MTNSLCDILTLTEAKVDGLCPSAHGGEYKYIT